MNVVVIAAKQNGLLKHFPFLESHGYKLHWMSDISAAKVVVSKAKPELILLSWDIPAENIVKAYREFESEMGIPCLVFTENQGSRSLSDLSRSGIPNVLLPPVTGTSIHSRIQLLIRRKVIATRPLREVPEAPKPVNLESMPGKAEVLENAVFDDEMEVAQLKEAVEKLLKDSFAEILKSSKSNNKKLTPNVVAVSLPSNKLKGYLLMGQDRVELDAEVLKALYALLASKLGKTEPSLESNSDAIGIGTDFPSFEEWARSVSEIALHDTMDGDRITIAFLDGDELPKVAENIGQRYLEAEFKDWLTPNTVLQFDLFIHLKANDKHILYLKKETKISDDTVGRFARLDIPKIFIDPSEVKGFISYCIQVKLKRDLIKDVKESA